MSGFWGSEPFAVMIAVELALLVALLLLPPLAHPVSTSALAAARANAPTPIRLILKVSSCANWENRTGGLWSQIRIECVAHDACECSANRARRCDRRAR